MKNSGTSILQITQEFFPQVSGPAHVALELARGFEQQGVPALVWTTTPSSYTDNQANDIDVHRFSPVFSSTNFRPSITMLYSLTKNKKPAVMHVHGWRNPISDSAIFTAHHRQIPLVIHAHGVAFGYRYANGSALPQAVRLLYDRIMRLVVTRYADAVVACTRQEASELQEYGFPASRIAIIPIGVSELFFTEREVRSFNSDGTLKLLVVGRLGARRNIEQILLALALLQKWGIPAKLRVVGPEVRLSSGDATDYRHKLEGLAQELGIRNDVTFTGPKQGIALLAEYLSADVFVYTTLYENFGLPIAEAAATGLPIVATPTGIATYFLSEQTPELLVPFHDEYATAVAIRILFNNSIFRNDIGRNIKRISENLRWNKIIPQYLNLYSNICHGHKFTKRTI